MYKLGPYFMARYRCLGFELDTNSNYPDGCSWFALLGKLLLVEGEAVYLSSHASQIYCGTFKCIIIIHIKNLVSNYDKYFRIPHKIIGFRKKNITK